MKKILGYAGAALLAVSLTGCLGDDDVESVNRIARPVLNHLAPVDGEGDVIVSKGEYSLRFDNVANEMTVSTSTLQYGNAAHSMATKDFDFKVYNYNLGDYRAQMVRWQGGEGNLAADGSAPVTGLTGMLTDLYYFDYALEIPGIAPMTQNVLSRLLLSYTYDNRYKVTTFYPDAMFLGETSTTVPGGSEPYKNVATRYRVVMDWEKNTASLVIYDAKFAQAMPSLSALLVEGLKVEWTKEGYVITGSDKVASSVENGEATPMPAFPFNSIRIETVSADMAQVKIDYTVAGRFQGSFTGSYVQLPAEQ